MGKKGRENIKMKTDRDNCIHQHKNVLVCVDQKLLKSHLLDFLVNVLYPLSCVVSESDTFMFKWSKPRGEMYTSLCYHEEMRYNIKCLVDWM